jgi:hypothetical protein
MSKTVFQRGRENSLTGNTGMTWVFSGGENKYPWTWKTVLVSGREFFVLEES